VIFYISESRRRNGVVSTSGCFWSLSYASACCCFPYPQDVQNLIKKVIIKKILIAKAQKNSRNLVLYSAAALVADQQTGECLVSKQPQAVLPIASITKLMTAVVVLDANMDLEETITIEREDVDTILHSRSRLPVGTDLTRREALLLALMSSDNRCAHALGRTYPGGMRACVKAMNAKARSLGLSETRFEDTAGLSSGNVSSAMDLVASGGSRLPVWSHL